MDLFKAFPSLNTIEHKSLNHRNLRLISISGIVYDDEAIYFEISPERYWSRVADAKVTIGVGLPKVNPDTSLPPYKSLIQYLHRNWRCETNLHPPGYALLMDENRNVSLIPELDNPFFMQMTKPRLGGSNTPDALVQACYLLSIKRFDWHSAQKQVNLVKINRSSFADFIEREIWHIEDLNTQPWSEYHVNKPLPQDGVVRLVLMLRSLREILRTDHIDINLLSAITPN